MSNTVYKMVGIFCIIISIFVLLGALFLTADFVPVLVNRLCWIVGLALLACGVIFYKVLKKET